MRRDGERGPKGDHGQAGDEGHPGERGLRGRDGGVALFVVLCALVAGSWWSTERDSCERQQPVRAALHMKALDCNGLFPDK